MFNEYPKLKGDKVNDKEIRFLDIAKHGEVVWPEVTEATGISELPDYPEFECIFRVITDLHVSATKVLQETIDGSQPGTTIKLNGIKLARLVFEKMTATDHHLLDETMSRKAQAVIIYHIMRVTMKIDKVANQRSFYRVIDSLLKDLLGDELETTKPKKEGEHGSNTEGEVTKEAVSPQ